MELEIMAFVISVPIPIPFPIPIPMPRFQGQDLQNGPNMVNISILIILGYSSNNKLPIIFPSSAKRIATRILAFAKLNGR